MEIILRYPNSSMTLRMDGHGAPRGGDAGRSLFEVGPQRVIFDGSSLPSGLYYYTLWAEGFVTTRSMLLLK